MDPYELHECYVCYEPCDTLAECKCKTLYVHSSCVTIMRLYGKNECGVCKEPYPPLSQPLELFEDELFDLESPPCYCYIFPTALRPEYDVTDCDQFIDLFRILIVIVGIFAACIMFTDYSKLDFLTPFTLCFLSLMICCFVAEQRTRRFHRRIDQPTHREPQTV
jgi:hypothetical protein